MEALVGSPVTVRSYQNIALALSHILGLSLENVRLLDKLIKQSILDPLTPTYNRRYLDAKLDEEFKRASRYRRPLAVLMIDVNNFARINNTMGHRQGDVILQEIGRTLNESTREVDVVARYGGDEFVIVMPETSGEHARLKAQSLMEQIAGALFTSVADDRKSLRVSCSIGAVGIDEEPSARTPEELLRRADELMYQTKRRLKKTEPREDTRHR
jgi:diguanylate cyclase (GGDEF)-like protein